MLINILNGNILYNKEKKNQNKILLQWKEQPIDGPKNLTAAGKYIFKSANFHIYIFNLFNFIIPTSNN